MNVDINDRICTIFAVDSFKFKFTVINVVVYYMRMQRTILKYLIIFLAKDTDINKDINTDLKDIDLVKDITLKIILLH